MTGVSDLPTTTPHHRARKSQKATMKGIITAVGTALVAAVLAVVLLIGVLAVAVPAVTGSGTYTILTSSMRPALPPGTFVIVRRSDPADLRVGDIITYQLVSGKPEVVTHRIVKVTVDSKASRTFVTRGDNNAVADATPVQPAQIKGRVWYAIPFVGWIAGVRNTAVGSIALSVIGWALLAYGLVIVALAVVRRSSARRGRGRSRRTEREYRPPARKPEYSRDPQSHNPLEWE